MAVVSYPGRRKSSARAPFKSLSHTKSLYYLHVGNVSAVFGRRPRPCVDSSFLEHFRRTPCAIADTSIDIGHTCLRFLARSCMESRYPHLRLLNSITLLSIVPQFVRRADQSRDCGSGLLPFRFMDNRNRRGAHSAHDGVYVYRLVCMKWSSPGVHLFRLALSNLQEMTIWFLI